MPRHARNTPALTPERAATLGLTEAWRIAWAAYESNVRWVPHGWNTAVGLAADVPLLGICYGEQSLCHQLGGAVVASDHREFGRAEVEGLEAAGIF